MEMLTLDIHQILTTISKSFEAAGYEVQDKAENQIIVSNGDERVNILLSSMLTKEQEKTRRTTKNQNASKRRGRFKPEQTLEQNDD